MKKYAPAFIALTVFVVFSFAPAAKFLQWDDAANLLNNDKWRGMSWANIKWMWSTRHYGPWQPLSWFSWGADYSLWGLDASAFRRTNVLLHSLTAALVFLTCRRAFSSVYGAAGAALFFALHPLRVESVVWITERRDVLSGFFAVLSVWAWLENRKHISLLSFVFAVLSKGTAIAVLPFLFVLDRKSAKQLIPHAVVGLFAACKNLGGFSTGDVHAVDLGLFDRILVAGNGAWFYLSKTLMPINLSPYYALSLNGDGIRQESYPGALLAQLVTVLCFHKRVRSWAVPVWFSYLIALAPVSGLLQNGRQAAADRYSYLACLPFAVLFGLGLDRLKKQTSLAVLYGAALALSVATIRQSSFWKDDVSLWSRAVEIQPDAYLPNSNLSVALLVAGRGAAAVPFLEAAMRLEPRDAEARVNLASIVAQRDPARAIYLFREAVELKPNDPSFASARYNLGLLLVREGHKSDGLAQMREAVRLNPALNR
ncbi:MAG: tetratricopeptide repeat protein [Elusimicrobia bacterium]|nr:tetratricopeptide repeat protein [Elusimicrobiota bacterium]